MDGRGRSSPIAAKPRRGQYRGNLRWPLAPPSTTISGCSTRSPPNGHGGPSQGHGRQAAALVQGRRARPCPGKPAAPPRACATHACGRTSQSMDERAAPSFASSANGRLSGPPPWVSLPLRSARVSQDRRDDPGGKANQPSNPVARVWPSSWPCKGWPLATAFGG